MIHGLENDIHILRELAAEYKEIAVSERQKELKELWRKHNSLEKTRTPIVCSWDEGSNMADELLADRLLCKDSRLRRQELFFRNSIYHAAMGDDWIYEPFITIPAVKKTPWEQGGSVGMWGQNIIKTQIAQAYITEPVIETIDDIQKLCAVEHEVDEAATQERREFYQDVFGGAIDICINRRPFYHSLGGWDLSTSMGELLGLENMMVAMFEEPELVHALAAFMQKAVLTQLEQAELQQDWTPHGGWWETEGTPYCNELPDPDPFKAKNSMKNLWGFFAAQEFTLISPAMHEEFLLEYQRPICEKFGLISYGCCENLTNKIDMLRSIPNLRRIGITPTADVASCARQIERDYVFAWRPNPAMVCAYFDRGIVKSQMEEGLKAAQGCCVDIMLKDVSTVQGEPKRLQEWIDISKEAAAKYD